MDEIICNGSINTDGKKILIDGINSDNIEIDFDGDINFTNLVSILTEKIDDGRKIKFTIEEQTDEKLMLIAKILKSIFDSYNESLDDVEEETDDEEEFWFVEYVKNYILLDNNPQQYS